MQLRDLTPGSSDEMRDALLCGIFCPRVDGENHRSDHGHMVSFEFVAPLFQKMVMTAEVRATFCVLFMHSMAYFDTDASTHSEGRP